MRVEVERLDVKPGDQLVARTQDVLTAEKAARIVRSLQAVFPEGVRVLVLDASITLEVEPGNTEITS